MARGNLIQGYGRGKLGSTVYSISHGVQVSRVYNPAKFDRKSDSQIIRRAQWIAASQYYSRAVASQFKFAFENKKPNESFQNAFMKRNWNRGVLRAYGDVSNPNYPSVGRFVISEGSLRPISVVYHENGGFYFTIPTIEDSSIASNTLGYLSRCMVKLGYRNGDIVTFTIIRTSALAGSNLQPIVSGETAPEYFYIQITLDVNSEVLLTSMHIVVLGGNVIGDNTSQGYEAYVPHDAGVIMGACVQVSRKTRAKLLVSYAEITLNPDGMQAMMYGQSNEWRQTVIDSWKSSGNALLQGDESENATDDSVVTILSDLSFPRTFESLNNKAIVTNKILNATQFGERIIFYKPNGDYYRAFVFGENQLKINYISSGNYSATIQQDSTDPYRWAIQSSDLSNTVQTISAKNI